MRILILIVVSIGMLSVAATIIVGTRTFDGTVAEDPYTEGLDWDASLKSRTGGSRPLKLGIHTHNDCGMAEANAIRAHYGLRPLKHKNG